MFLLNSRMGHFTAPPGIALKDPFSRSYGAMLPSSLTRFLPRALVSLYPPTCVGFGTACIQCRVAFPGSRDAWRNPGEPGRRPAIPRRTGDSHCPPPLSFSDNALEPYCMCRNVDLLSIDYALRPRLRCRLTPGGRTCPGKPWDSGDQNFHLVFRYSCPHNRSCEVHRRFPARLRPVARRSPTIGLAAGPRIRFDV